MSSGWFETVAAAQRGPENSCRNRCYWSIVAGSEQGATRRTTWRRSANWGSPRTPQDCPAQRDLATTVLGQRCP